MPQTSIRMACWFCLADFDCRVKSDLPVAAGDINGDGRADVIFCGMYGSSGSRENNGIVNFYISDGRDSGFVNAAENPANIFKLAGQRSGDLLGTSVSANGDVNGDGIRDVAIGACLWTHPAQASATIAAPLTLFWARGTSIRLTIFRRWMERLRRA